MSDLSNDTREQSPEDVRRTGPVPIFVSGDAVPGLNSWVLGHKLGGGGFGEVWLAKHAFDAAQKPRAVKFCTDPAARHRLVTHERNVVVRVMKYAGKHPNIVPLLEYNLDGGAPWLMYELVEGGTLAESLGQWRALSPSKRLGRVVKALHAISGALAACHRLDPPLVHRDLKPQNVLMDGPVPRITDFGIGSVVFEPGPTTGALTALAARIPNTLQGAGTRLYAPPEQMFGGAPSPREDVYALGIIAYQLVTGDLMSAPGADAKLELRDGQVPNELASLIVRSVSMNPDRRPQDAGEWESVLAALVARDRQQPAPTDTGSPSAPFLIPVLPETPPTDLPEENLPPAEQRPARDPRPARRSRLWLALGCAGLFLAATVLALIFALRPTDGTANAQPVDTDAQPPVPQKPNEPVVSEPPRPKDTTPKDTTPKATPPKARRPVRSDFNQNDADGWTTVNGRNQPGTTRPIGFDHAGGQWWLTATRVGSELFFWSAPEKFLGDQADRFGKWLVYYTFTPQPPPPDIREQVYVFLRSPNGQLAARGTDIQSRKNNFGWTVHAVRLNAAAGWQYSLRPGQKDQRRLATDSEVKAVLSDVKVLLIRGEYQTKPEGCIDMIEFGADEPPK